MNPSECFGKNVVYYLRQNGIRVGDFEKRIGVCTGYLSRCGRGGKGMSLNLACEIADELNVPINKLVSGDRAKEDRIKRLESELNKLKN